MLDVQQRKKIHDRRRRRGCVYLWWFEGLWNYIIIKYIDWLLDSVQCVHCTMYMFTLELPKIWVRLSSQFKPIGNRSIVLFIVGVAIFMLCMDRYTSIFAYRQYIMHKPHGIFVSKTNKVRTHTLTHTTAQIIQREFVDYSALWLIDVKV